MNLSKKKELNLSVHLEHSNKRKSILLLALKEYKIVKNTNIIETEESIDTKSSNSQEANSPKSP